MDFRLEKGKVTLLEILFERSQFLEVRKIIFLDICTIIRASILV